MSDPIADHALLTVHTTSPETHHEPCGTPWMTSHTVDGDGRETSTTLCPACGTPS